MIRIFLVGYMGAGKTTLGKAFARVMKLSFVDLDWYIEERFHKTISQLFAERGEAAFRELERNALHEVGEFEDVIIATGGGTPCFCGNMDYMNTRGETVFLNVNQSVLFVRLKIASMNRPMIKGKSDEELRAFIMSSLEKRLPIYNQAKYVFDGSRLETKTQVVESVCRLQQLLNITH
ncbi:MAG: shikimate kinase [Bacteroidales bacterium]|nr:shikimate kinase [Bacteroidales bacterium]